MDTTNKTPMDKNQSQPTQEQLESAHRCLSAIYEGFRQAIAVGGKNAKVHAGDIVQLIEVFNIGPDPLAAKRDVEGPFYPRGVQ